MYLMSELYCYNIECNDFTMHFHKVTTIAMWKCFNKLQYQTRSPTAQTNMGW